MKPVKTSKDRAAVLARLTESQRGTQAGAGERGQQPSVAVKILTAIPAGDSGQKTAMLMTRNGGVLQETGQTVLVRHVGEGSVSVGAIVTPEPCGRLGLCFTRSVQVVQAAIKLRRPLEIVEQIPAESGVVAAYTIPWKFGPFATAYSGRPASLRTKYTQTGYFAECDFSVPPDSVNIASQNALWEFKMRPMRWRLHGYDGELCSQLYDQQRVAGFAQQSSFPLSVGEVAAIGASGHLSPVLVSAISIEMSGVLATFFNVVSSSTPSLGGGRTFLSRKQVAFYRLWIDGADVTGIQATTNELTIGSGQQSVRAAIAEGEYLGKSMTLDIWCRYVVLLGLYGQPHEPMGANYTIPEKHQVGWLDSANLGSPVVCEAVNYSSAITVTGTKFQLDFDVNGPFGLSTLVMQTDTTAGWAFTTPSNTQQMAKETGFSSPGVPANGAVHVSLSLNWLESDRPLLTYVRRDFTTAKGWSTKTWHYRPEPSAAFAGTISPSGFSVKHGAWNPSVASAFKLFAGIPASQAQLEFRNAGDGIIPKADWLAVPQTITVTKV